MNQMKKGILSLITWTLPFILLAQNDTSHGINWIEGLTWEQVKQKAKTENKCIFLDCYATWCGPCKLMDKNVYPDGQVGNIINAQFVSVRVQMDKTDHDNEQAKIWYNAAQQLSREYGIGGYPSFLFFNSSGKLLHKAIGARNVSDFKALVKDALTDPEEKYETLVKKNEERAIRVFSYA